MDLSLPKIELQSRPSHVQLYTAISIKISIKQKGIKVLIVNDIVWPTSVNSTSGRGNCEIIYCPQPCSELKAVAHSEIILK